MAASRRTFLLSLGFATLLSFGARAQQDTVLKVDGTVTAANFAGLATFIENSTDRVVGLDVKFPAVEEADAGGLVASAGSDGLFIAYLSDNSTGGGDNRQISVREGVVLRDGAHVVSGFFRVEYAGMNQGITALYLERTDEASVLSQNAAVKDLDIDALDPSIRKQD